MDKTAFKYTAAFAAAFLFVGMVFAVPQRMGYAQTPPVPQSQSDAPDPATANPMPLPPDTIAPTPENPLAPQSANPPALQLEDPAMQADTMPGDSIRIKNFLEQPITSKNRDSLVYNVRDKVVRIYGEGDVVYGNINMKADYMRITMDTKEMFAYGLTDTLGGRTRPEFIDGGQSFTMDTITYNFDTQKAKIKGVITQEGEGFLRGENVKRQHDQSIHIKDGTYTTCDDPDCPHFYLRMTRAKVLPGEKVIIGPSYLVLVGVPLYFFLLPEGFFPISSGRSSGIIIPSYGEESIKGFFLRDGGYYFAFNDHVDMQILGGIYTRGSWEASAQSQYVVRYKYRGNVTARFSKDIVGEEGDADYSNANNFRLAWTHSQDSKFRPGSTFSASVNLSTSGYSKTSAQTLQEQLNTQTNSSVAYSKTWAGTPFSFSTNLQVSQNSQNATTSISFPNAVFNMSRINPFQRKNAPGKQLWYEKITMSYTGTLSNSVSNVKEEDLFTDVMFKGMSNSVVHSIPISTSFNVLNYVNVSPNANYTERWNFRKIEQEYINGAIQRDTTQGFYRVYSYNVALSASTKLFGMYQFKSKTSPIQAIRHTITPSVSASYAPDFGDPRFGFYRPIQTDSTGMNITYYSPFEGAPSRGQTAALSFSVGQTLEAKVLSKRDTSGLRKVSFIDNFSFSGSYNFLADSMNLSTINLSLRMTLPFLKNFGLNLSATLDPYVVVDAGNGTPQRLARFMLREEGKLGRITSTGWSFGYTFNGGKNGNNQPAVNNLNSQYAMNDASVLNPYYFDPDDPIDAALRRTMMVSTYYDFSIPWNLGFNYSVSYRDNGLQKTITQTTSFNGSVTLTPKWGITFNGGFDFVTRKLTPGTFTLSRDLHCWQFNFNWVPVGTRRQWSFNISAKSSMLKDLKYDKRSSQYDRLYDDL